jgi:hypothetical protein
MWPNLQIGQLEYTIYTCVLGASGDQRFGRRVASEQWWWWWWWCSGAVLQWCSGGGGGGGGGAVAINDKNMNVPLLYEHFIAWCQNSGDGPH